ncbi:MAG: OmpA family protein [Bacteroidales bacterium]|jgi:outer membrane protein OmpA-like peptidoglycan-associated protein|nr:OmpA family protein [Bacteroidales bacterium]
MDKDLLKTRSEALRLRNEQILARCKQILDEKKTPETKPDRGNAHNGKGGQTPLSVLLCVALCLSATFSLSAQRYRSARASVSPHEIAAHLGLGYSTLRYQPAQGSRMGGFNAFGGEGGIDYMYMFSEKFGVATGAGVALYRARTDLGGLDFVKYGLHGDQHDYDLHTILETYRERQWAWMAVIPLTLQYQTDLQRGSRMRITARTGDADKFYLRAGVKAGLPFNARYSVKDAVIRNARYYPADDAWLEDRPTEGLGTYSAWGRKDRINGLKTAWSLTFETGVKWGIEQNLWLYTGIYMDYGLNNVNTSSHEEEFLYMPEDDPSMFVTRSILTAQQSAASGQTAAGLTGALSPLSVGVNLRLAFGYPSDVIGGSGRARSGARGGSKSQSAWRSGGSGLTKAQRAFTSNSLLAQKGVTEAMSKLIKSALDNIRIWTGGEERRKRQEMRFAAEKVNQNTDRQEQKIAEVQEFQQAVETISETMSMSGYAVNAFTLSPESRRQLDEKVALLKKYPKLRVICEGHTDNSGTHAQNLTVGQRRAEAVKRYLVSQGIPASRIQTGSKAETEPIAPNDTEENKAKNRRVEFEVRE